MTVLKEICVAARKYTNNQGEEKTVWKKIGEIHASKDGREYIVLDPTVNLAGFPRKEGDDRVFASMFEPKLKDTPKKSAKASGDIDSDLPF